jgi:hypothetical protein
MYHRAILLSYPENSGLATFKYFESAMRTFDVYEQMARHLGGFSAVGPVLDFGSGWGRLSRCLVQKMKRENIWVSDIYSDATAWQAEKLGVVGVVSVSDPDRFALTGSFSIIFVGSVFSHLPDDLFQRWLGKLYSLLSPNGILAFSVLDETYLQAGELAGQTVGAEGFAYFEISESASLDHKIYGAMYVRENYVRESVAKLDLGRKVGLKLFKSGLYENQDLYVLAGANVDLSSLDLIITPHGGMTSVSQENGVSSIGGWGIDLNKGHQLVKAELFLDDDPVELIVPTVGYAEAEKYFPVAPNPAVSWTFQFSRPVVVDLIRVELKSSSGAVMQIYAAPRSDGGNVPRT